MNTQDGFEFIEKLHVIALRQAWARYRTAVDRGWGLGTRDLLGTSQPPVPMPYFE
jgi:hypothetical protein